MKKVLIIGTDFFGYTESVERAFNKLGFDTKTYIYKREVTSLKEKLEYHISFNKKKFIEEIIPERFNKRLLNLYQSFQPDLVFIFQETPLEKSTIKKMKNSLKVIWLMDSIFRKHYIYNIRDLADYIFLFEKTDVEKLSKEEQKTTHFLPCALDETIYYPIDSEKEIDLLFVGHIYENRFLLLRKIAERFNDKTLKFYGLLDSSVRVKYDYYLKENRHIFLDCNINPSKTNELYSKSKINLNVHHSQSFYGSNQRFYEISGSKSFQLVDGNDYINDYFDASEIMTYNSEEELMTKIDSTSRNGEIRRLFAQNAYCKVIKKHTFISRIEEILKIVWGGNSDLVSFNVNNNKSIIDK